MSSVLTLVLIALACEDSTLGPANDGGLRVRGVTLADWTPTGYANAQAAIDDIAATGANTLVLIVTAYQRDVSASDFAVDPARTPTPAAISSAISAGRARGLNVVLKPHIDVDTGAWRGLIAPGNDDAWFGVYAEWITELVRLAEQSGVAQFVVGTELAGVSGHTGRWRDIIRIVRGEFSGEVTYAASWDEAHRVGFWDALDVIGVDFYAPVARRDDAGRMEIMAGWQIWIERLRHLSHQTDRRIVFTEIGYRSIDGAGTSPSTFGNAARVDLGEQADLYWAALTVLGGQEWCDGVCWWNWLVRGNGGASDDDFTPKNKPAEGELVRAWSN